MRMFDNLCLKDHESEFHSTKKWKNDNIKPNQKLNFQSYNTLY